LWRYVKPSKKSPLQIAPLDISLAPDGQKILVEFERTVPVGPLDETVWDNTVGPFVDGSESEQIGYTQDYSVLMPAEAIGGIPGTVVAVAVGTSPTYTRIVIPFGRIFESVFVADLRKVFTNSVVADDLDETNHLNPTTVTRVVKLRVMEFNVWEHPLNHLNLSATVNCSVYLPQDAENPGYEFETHNVAISRPIGSVLSTSSGFIRNMNKISNQFASELSQMVLENLKTNLNQSRPVPQSGTATNLGR
jgi:hypothetical protein